MKRRFAYLLVLAPLTPFACNGGSNPTTDGGPDAARDGTSADVRDAGSDVKVDVTSDVGTDVTAADASDGGGSAWHTPTCDGAIGATEYGDANYQTVSSSETWYLTWDSTNLYVALAVANVQEGAILYVGYSGNGLTTGQSYDGTDGTLPFAADAVVYAKSGYQEIRLADVDAGSWGSTPDTTSVQFCDDGNTTREEVIPWTALGATGIPASFRFVAYATSSVANGSVVYGQIPTSNPSGPIGTTAVFTNDFYVSSTADGSGAFPFATTE